MAFTYNVTGASGSYVLEVTSPSSVSITLSPSGNSGFITLEQGSQSVTLTKPSTFAADGLPVSTIWGGTASANIVYKALAFSSSDFQSLFSAGDILQVDGSSNGSNLLDRDALTIVANGAIEGLILNNTEFATATANATVRQLLDQKLSNVAGELATINGADTGVTIDAHLYSTSFILNGGSGADTLIGGSGADSIYGSSGNDAIYGGNGNDTLTGGSENDRIEGGAGADTINVDIGTDTITDLGNGQDVLIVTGSAIATATVATSWTATSATNNSGTGTVTLDLDSGVNLDLTGITGGSAYTITAAGNTAGSSYVRGSIGNDNITGSSLADELRGYNGNDTINGGAGNDIIFGGSGNDSIIGSAGADTITVDWGTDTITDLGNGQDALVVTGGAVATATVATSWTATSASSNNGTVTLDLDSGIGVSLIDVAGTSGFNITADGNTAGSYVRASANADTIVGSSTADELRGYDGNDTIYGSSGNDTIYGGNGNDTLTGGSENDRIEGGAGADTINVDIGTDTITDLGNGQDVLIVTGSAIATATVATSWTATSATKNSGAATLDLDSGVNLDLTGITGGNAYTITAAGNTAGSSYVRGSLFDDNITGSSLADELRGYNGNDTVNGGAGNDVIFGGSGNDSIIGGAGADTITVDWGTDTITDLGNGQDALVVTGGAVATATVATSWTATSASSNNGTATLDLDPGVGVNLTAAGGNQGFTITADGNTAGSFVRASANADVIMGSSAADELRGYDGNDSINGGSGNDTIFGGLGNDTITGGSNIDTITVDWGTDTITDLGYGQDVLVVTNGAVANATVVASWTATASTSNTGGDANLTLNNSVNLDLSAASGSTGFDVTMVGANAHNVTGSSLADNITGYTAADTIFGGAGNDVITGGIGDDSISGGSGADTINVDAGTDTVIDLGLGQDVLVVSNDATANVTVGTSWTATSDTVNNGTATLDLNSNVGVNLVSAGGSAGFTIDAHNNGNTEGSFIRGSANADNITGSSLSDELRGFNGNDIIDGKDGRDDIWGGVGADTLVGGDGADTFHYDSVATGITLATADQIGTSSLDFNASVDLISTGVAGLTSSQVSIVNGGSLDFTGFTSAASDAFAAGKAVYVAYGYNGGADALVAINNNGGVTFTQGDSLIKIVGVDTAQEILVSNFIA